MGLVKQPPPSVRFAAVFSHSPEVLARVWPRLEAAWGPLAVLGTAFHFVESEYYLKTMCPGTTQLFKQLAVFAEPYDPGHLSQDKLQSNRWEEEWGEEWGWGESLVDSGVVADRSLRLVNIDPGYMSMTKLVLASTKNREHRLYLQSGIYAEVTLAYRDQRWQAFPWTYADYQRPDVLEYLARAREWFTRKVATDSRGQVKG